MADEQKERAKAWSCEAAGHTGGRRLRTAVTRKRSVLSLVGRVRHCAACYQQHRHRERDARSQIKVRYWSVMMNLYEYHRVSMRLLFDRAPLEQVEKSLIVKAWEKVRRNAVKYSYDCDRCK